jgi:predicted phage-related endonuclease
VEATPAVAAAVDRLKQVKAEIKALEAEEESLADIIKPFIGSAAALSAAGKIIATWKAQSASRLDIRAIEAAHPDIVAAFKRTTETRVLRLK